MFIMKKLSEYKWIILGSVLGGIGGYFYWKDVGCTSGKCIIQSNWQVMIPYGMLTGYFISDFILTTVRKINNKTKLNDL
jgi:hypothetical protein